MAFIRLEDMTGSAEVIVFPKTYDKFGKYLYEDKVIIVEGRASISEGEEPKIVGENIIPFDKIEEKPKPVSIGIVLENGVSFDSVRHIIEENHGSVPLYINDKASGKKYRTDENYWLNVNDDTLKKLKACLGDENVVTKYR